MTHAQSRFCPDPQTLAAFADGQLTGADLVAVVEHLDTCDACTGDVALAIREAGAGEDRAPHAPPAPVVRPRRWTTPWLAAAAAAVLGVLLLPPLARTLRRSPVERLVALAPTAARVVEPRLSGGFAWSPYRGPDRSSRVTADPAQMKLAGAAGEMIERAQRDPSAQAQHGAGVAMVLTLNADAAIGKLEMAAQGSPSAQTWNDLAAARYAAAADHDRTALYPRALAAADAALALDPALPEALFNRALILERLGLVDEARRAWSRYLASDASSKWADEARARLADLPAAKSSSRFERERPLIEDAAASGDTATVRALLAEHAARARAFAEAEYLGRWGEAVLEQKHADAERWLRISRELGAVIADTRHDWLLRDAVQAIDAQGPPGRQAIAAAHAAYRSGRIAYSRQRLEPALRDLERAADLFADTRSPMAFAARYYLAGIRQARQDPDAGAALERVLADLEGRPDYRSLRAHVRWEVGRARMLDYDWTRAIAVLTESARLFRDGGDRINEAFVGGILAYCLAAEGRGDESWNARIGALRALSAEGNPARLASAIDGAVRADFRAGRTEAALALARIPPPAGETPEQRSLVLDGVLFTSMLESQSGSPVRALEAAQRAVTLAEHIADPSLRERRLADADVATGAAIAASDPRGAIAPLTRAIDFYRKADVPFELPEPLLLRARCLRRIGDTPAAARDLEEGMRIVERHPTGAGPDAATGILDVGRALFSDAIGLSLDRGDDAGAFAIAERARAAVLTVGELQARLHGSATAVVETALLSDEIVIFAVTENALKVVRRKADVATLRRLADAALSETGTAAAAELYDQVLRPVDALLSRVNGVILIPDPRLDRLAGAALFDRDRRTYLVERVAVAMASSAASLHRDAARGGSSLVTLTLPAGGTTGTAPLAQTGAETAEIGGFYPQARAITTERATLSALRQALSAADVVHVAGHTERQADGGEHALLLAAAGGQGVERASSRTIAAMPPPRARLLVLAACETLRPPASEDTRALSLGAAFAAAGVVDVIGTLTPVGDRDARVLFRDLHRQLASGASARDALRAAQLTAIRTNQPAWRSVALLTRRIESSKREPSS